jgi:hypothetical protein
MNCLRITILVMTFPQVSPANQDSVHPLDEGIQNEVGIHPARAHYPDNPDIGGILKSGNTRSIRPSVTTPVAKKA